MGVRRAFRRGVKRREFLRWLGAAGAGAALVPAADALAGAATGTDPAYPQGVGAGDPAPDGGLIWTRVAPPLGGRPVEVAWEVATDAEFATIVAGGATTATAATDHTVKVAVDGLAADRWYHYRFTANAVPSRAGRLRTAPRPDAVPDHLRLVFSSCQQRNSSYYVAHKAIAEEGADFFMHLGDYVYGSDEHTLSLDDYRGLYRTFKSNPLLQDAHAAMPLVAVWDDGEFHNGFNRFADPQRTENARQAWFEFMPAARRSDDPARVHRSFPWGRLADVLLLDVRSYSDQEVTNIFSLSEEGRAMMDPSRTLLGAAQKQWLKDGLAASTAMWRLLGQGFMILPWRLADFDFPWVRQLCPKWQRNAGVYAPTSDWDDYQGDRRDLLGFLAESGICNNVFLSGDLHLYFAGSLQPDIDDPTSPTVGFDFCTGSLTADPDPRTLLEPLPPDVAEQLIHLAEQYSLAANPHMAFCDLLHQGYVVVDVTPESVEVTMRMIDTSRPDAVPWTGARFRILHDATSLERLQP